MNKTELIKALAEKTGKPQTEAKVFLDAFTDTVTETLAKGDKIALIAVTSKIFSEKRFEFS